MPNTPDTPFAELLHAVQSNATHITWQKSNPISDRERADAKKKRKTVVIDNPFNARNADRQNKHLFLLFLSPCMQPSKLTPIISWLASLIILAIFLYSTAFQFFHDV